MNWTNADDQWINLIAEDTIEQRMLGTLEAKRGVADGILDRVGDLKAIKLKRGGQTFLSRLEQMIVGSLATVKKLAFPAASLPPDPTAALAYGAQVLGTQLTACEERFPEGDTTPCW